MHLWRKILASAVLLSFSILALFGLLITATQLREQTHHHTTAADTCPFLPGEQTHCLMNFQDHLNAWEQLMRVTPIYKTILLLVCVLVAALRMPWFKTSAKQWIVAIDLPPPSASFFATTIQPRAP